MHFPSLERPESIQTSACYSESKAKEKQRGYVDRHSEPRGWGCPRAGELSAASAELGEESKKPRICGRV